MPWAEDEPEELAAKVRRLRGMRDRFEQGEDFIYGTFSPDETAVLGGAGLHKRIGAHGLEIGYWIHVDPINQGLATEIAAALIRAGFELHGVKRLEIHCDPANAPSAAVPRKLGYAHVETVRETRAASPGGERDTMVWRPLRKDYPHSAAAAYEIEAFDKAGECLL